MQVQIVKSRFFHFAVTIDAKRPAHRHRIFVALHTLYLLVARSAQNGIDDFHRRMSWSIFATMRSGLISAKATHIFAVAHGFPVGNGSVLAW